MRRSGDTATGSDNVSHPTRAVNIGLAGRGASSRTVAVKAWPGSCRQALHVKHPIGRLAQMGDNVFATREIVVGVQALKDEAE